MTAKDKVRIAAIETEIEMLQEKLKAEQALLFEQRRSSSFTLRQIKFKLENLYKKLSLVDRRDVMAAQVENTYKRELNRRRDKVRAAELQLERLAATLGKALEGNIPADEFRTKDEVIHDVSRQIGIEKTKLANAIYSVERYVAKKPAIFYESIDIEAAPRVKASNVRESSMTEEERQAIVNQTYKPTKHTATPSGMDILKQPWDVPSDDDIFGSMKVSE